MCAVINYNSDSFDRFGDDFCEIILSYLPIEDCFRLQCVSKQFNALIFNKQTELILSDCQSFIANKSYYHKNSLIKQLVFNLHLLSSSVLICHQLEYVMKKCVNINKIVIDGNYIVTKKALEIISDSCKTQLLLHLSVRFDDILEPFAEKSLQNLESLTIMNTRFDNIIPSDRLLSQILMMPKLKALQSLCPIKFSEDFNNCREETNIEVMCIWLEIDDRFIRFAKLFKKRLIVLSITFSINFKIDLLKHLAEFEKLESIKCFFHYIVDGISCSDIIKQIGLYCTRLRTLTVQNIYSPFIEAFASGFRTLEQLNIHHYYNSENFALLKNCINLYCLKIHASIIRESDFKDIHLYLPKLKSIDICNDDLRIRVNAINLMKHLSKLSNLCDLKVGCLKLDGLNGITTDDIISFIDRSSCIRRIGIYQKNSKIDKNQIHSYIRVNNRKINVTVIDVNNVNFVS